MADESGALLLLLHPSPSSCPSVGSSSETGCQIAGHQCERCLGFSSSSSAVIHRSLFANLFPLLCNYRYFGATPHPSCPSFEVGLTGAAFTTTPCEGNAKGFTSPVFKQLLCGLDSPAPLGFPRLASHLHPTSPPLTDPYASPQ